MVSLYGLSGLGFRVWGLGFRVFNIKQSTSNVSQQGSYDNDIYHDIIRDISSGNDNSNAHAGLELYTGC